MPVATRSHSSDRRLLPIATVSYHCSNTLVATDRLPVATVTYDLLLQCLIIVVQSPLVHLKPKIVSRLANTVIPSF
jgi:hypothetical protein